MKAFKKFVLTNAWMKLALLELYGSQVIACHVNFKYVSVTCYIKKCAL